MNWRTPVTLTGKHVRLEPMSEAHVPGLAQVGLDERIWQHMLYGNIQTIRMKFAVIINDQIIEYCKRQYFQV